MKLIPDDRSDHEVLWTWRRLMQKTDLLWEARWTVPQMEPLPKDEHVFICPTCGEEMNEYSTGDICCPHCGEHLRPCD
jgi:predicted amidophosphoribosyltransferase